jgi:hypothetical protein
MAEWASIEKYIHSTYRVASQEGTWMTLHFDVGESRSQTIMVARAGNLIQFVSPFANRDEVSMDRVFAVLREEAIVLGITAVDRLLLVTHSQLLDTADEEEINAGIELVLGAADALESRLSAVDRF